MYIMNWWNELREILTKSNPKPIKITLARWDLKKFWKANCRLDRKLFLIWGFKSRSIYNLFDRITIETKRAAKYQKKEIVGGLKRQNNIELVPQIFEFNWNKTDSKRLENNSKLLRNTLTFLSFTNSYCTFIWE